MINSDDYFPVSIDLLPVFVSIDNIYISYRMGHICSLLFKTYYYANI